MGMWLNFHLTNPSVNINQAKDIKPQAWKFIEKGEYGYLLLFSLPLTEEWKIVLF